MNREQQILLDLLIRFDRFCSEKKIVYYLEAGTLLGAIRHGGFIPWDDDIDILITKENYHKLLQVAPEMRLSRMELGAPELDDKYNKVVARISDVSTTSIVKSNMFHGEALGISIDIFVMDCTPADKIPEQEKNLTLYEEVLTYQYVCNDRVKKWADEYLQLMKEEKQDRQGLIKRLRSRLEQYREEESDVYIVRWTPNPQIYSIGLFGEPERVVFEGHSFPCPSKPLDFIREKYGLSWYMIPEEAQRHTHDTVLNFDVPYNNYIEDVEQFFDGKEMADTLKTRKKLSVGKRLNLIDAMEYTENILEIKMAAMDINERENELRELFKNEKYQAFAKAMKPVESVIGKCTRAGYVPEISQDLLLMEIKCLIYAGKHYVARKLLNLTGKELPGLMSRELEEMLSTITELQRAYQDKNISLQEEILGKMEGGKEMDISCIPNVLLSQIAVAESRENFISKDYLEACDYYLERLPEGWDIVKQKADLLYGDGMNEEAGRLYADVYANSRNGMDLFDISTNHTELIKEHNVRSVIDDINQSGE